eukprot:m.40779 g.40779  ORF g.40779 m.40779 type:complete len:135 (+) comp14855_c0_seq1:59-463(+)
MVSDHLTHGTHGHHATSWCKNNKTSDTGMHHKSMSCCFTPQGLTHVFKSERTRAWSCAHVKSSSLAWMWYLCVRACVCACACVDGCLCVFVCVWADGCLYVCVPASVFVQMCGSLVCEYGVWYRQSVSSWAMLT